MSTSLECTVTDCKAGPSGGKWKTPELPVTAALAILDRHRQDHHGTGSDVGRGGGGSGEGVSRGRLAKLERPKISENCTQQDFEFFWSLASHLARVSVFPTAHVDCHKVFSKFDLEKLWFLIFGCHKHFEVDFVFINRTVKLLQPQIFHHLGRDSYHFLKAELCWAEQIL